MSNVAERVFQNSSRGVSKSVETAEFARGKLTTRFHRTLETIRAGTNQCLSLANDVLDKGISYNHRVGTFLVDIGFHIGAVMQEWVHPEEPPVDSVVLIFALSAAVGFVLGRIVHSLT